MIDLKRLVAAATAGTTLMLSGVFYSSAQHTGPAQSNPEPTDQTHHVQTEPVRDLRDYVPKINIQEGLFIAGAAGLSLTLGLKKRREDEHIVHHPPALS